MTVPTSYRISGYVLDENGRSTFTVKDIPLRKTSEMSAISPKQQAAYWGLGISQNSPKPANFDELHKTNQPRIVWVMSGHLETVLQSGERRRRAAGDGNFVHGLCLHHSHMESTVPTTTLNLTFNGTEDFEFQA